MPVRAAPVQIPDPPSESLLWSVRDARERNAASAVYNRSRRLPVSVGGSKHMQRRA